MKKIYLFLLMICTTLSTTFGQAVQTYSTAGTFNFTVPAGVTSITVETRGAGGGGGGVTATSAAAGGGGGGGYAQAVIPVTPGTSYTVIVGAAGTAGTTAGTNGGTGGSSSFDGATVSAAGGVGGVGTTTTTPGTGGAGGAGLTGSILFGGGTGGTGIALTNSGGGGGGAGSSAAGGNASGSTAGAGGVTGGGAGATGRTTSGTGFGGIAPGGGGSGGLRLTASAIARAGGAGGAGRVIISYIGYCIPAPISVDGQGITNVTAGTINNTTVAEPGNYGNYSAMVFDAGQSTTATVNITYRTGYTYDTKIFIDFNDDFDFDDAGENVYTGVSLATNPTTLIATFIIPVSAPLGQHRMRIGGQDNGPVVPCYTGSFGSFEDYTINITTAPSCLVPTGLTNTITSSTTANHSWTAPSPAPSVGYEYAVTTSSTPPASGTATTATSAASTGLAANTTYYLHVRSDCGAGDFSTWVTASFFTGYCVPATTTQTSWIQNFVTTAGITNINQTNASGVAGGYIDQTATVSVSNYLGNATNFSLTAGGPTVGVAIWIDWNNNFIFETSERIFVTTFYSTTVTGAINIPALTPNGNYRMRVHVDYNNSAPSDPCGTTVTRGEFRDYTFSVVNPPACSTPTAVAVGSITTTAASVSFTCTSCTGTYIVEYGLSGFTPGLAGTAGAGGTVLTSATSPVALSGLTAATTYQVYVRQDCGAGSYSPNSGAVTFTTLFDCSAIATLTCSTPVTTGNLALTGGLYDFGTCGFGTPGRERIYSFTSGMAGTYTLNITSLNGGTGYLDYFFKAADGNCGVSTGYACIGDKNAVGTTTFTLAASTTYYIMVDAESTAGTTNHTFQIDCPAACAAPTALGSNTITTTSANATWTGTGTFILEYGLTGFTPGTNATAGAGGTIISPAVSPQAISGLTANTAYQFYVRQDCTAGVGGYSTNAGPSAFTTLPAPPANDDAPGAITLTLGAGCAGAPFTNAGATASAGESFPSCSGTIATPVWFKFTAPASGAVKVTTDVAPGTFTDSKIAIFSATNVNDYTTFNIISCDEDGGVIGFGYLSTVYATGLTAGTTYYIAVDKYSSGTGAGTFCITADELNQSMLSSTNTCASGYQTPFGGGATAYTGWVNLLDNTGNLVSLVRKAAGTDPSGFSFAQNVNTGAIRSAGGVFYLDRNYMINSTETNVDVQFFFLNTEMAALTTADGTTLATLAATKQDGATCQNNFAVANGASTQLTQTGNGSAIGVSWATFNVPSFSNFFLNKQGAILPITIEYFRGSKLATANYLDWKVTCTSEPSVFMSLERSGDGRNFKSIKDQTATATRCLQGFNYTDVSPLAGYNYYRLKTVTLDGKVKYSSIVTLLNREKGFELISLAPNPVKTTSTLSLTTVKGGKVDISVSDVTGKVVSKQSTVVIAGNNPINMNFSTLAAGTYNITVVNGENEIKTMRFVKF